MMKKTVLFMLVVFCAAAQMNLTAQTGNGKILVVYFSMPESEEVNRTDTVSGASRLSVNGSISGNLQFVAGIIHRSVGGDLVRIETAQSYPATHTPLLNQAQAEKNRNARPRLASRIENIGDYDTIFLGYPIWWYDLPMPLYSFLEQYDLSGKTIIPFVVHGGSGFSGTVETITRLQPNAAVSGNGLAISRNTVGRSENDITAWTRRLGMAR
ncbi:flavodoxin [Breznakiella homolactica]|uniref:Flavodoxin n=1 Tax=Breznakiella homolactica TaxID=2798577 RepID=A0A7T8B8S7_9SPIR|nr:flavodoxin [Breznakiella homolactica]QQO07697.1 flavodoxin [Breznakiella homolactica]